MVVGLNESRIMTYPIYSIKQSLFDKFNKSGLAYNSPKENLF